MKKVILAFAIIATFIFTSACASRAPKAEVTDIDSTVVETVDSVVVDSVAVDTVIVAE